MTKRESLYKYGAFGHCKDVRKKEHLAQLFSARSIYFAPNSELNDPFDLRPRFSVQNMSDRDLTDFVTRLLIKRGAIGTPAQVSERAQKILEDNGHLIRAVDVERAITSDLQNGIAENAGILCMSKVRDSILMFSHYGASHTGYCLEFDADILSAHFGAYMATKYCDVYPVINPLLGVTQETSQIMWGSKFSQWVYEDEVRFVSDASLRLSNGEAGGPGSKSYPKGALRSVTFGARVSVDHIQMVQEWLASRDDGPIPLFHTEIHASEYQLVRRELV